LQPITSLIEMLQGSDNHFGDLRFCQMANPSPKIKMMFDFLCC